MLLLSYDYKPLNYRSFNNSGTGGVETKDVGNGMITSEITINHAGPEHAGDYRCLARNLYGNDELLFRLFVKGIQCYILNI